MTKMMKALMWTGPLQAEVRDEPVPEVAENHVLLRVAAAGICGSDLHGYRGHSPVRTPPLILGHEVVALDEAGRAFVVNPLISCGECRLCRNGEPNLCPARGLLGLDRPGAFAEYVSVPSRNLIPLPSGMSPLLGTLVEPLATPMNALRSTQLDANSVVVVLGAGPIGLLAAYAARERGVCLVASVEINPERAEVAGLFADVVGSDSAAVRVAVDEASGGLGADLVIDAVGIEATWTAACGLARSGGVIAEVGLTQGTGQMAVGDLVRRGLTLRGVYAYTEEDFRRAFDLLRESPPPLDWVARAELNSGPKTLSDLVDGTGPIKVVFEL